MIEIVEHRSLDAADLTRAWDDLTDAGSCPSIFVSRPWVAAWAAAFGGGLEPLALVGVDAGVPVGLAPLFARGRVVEFPVNFLSLRGEALVSECDAPAFLGAALGHLRRRGVAAALRSVPRDSPTYGALSACRDAGYLPLETPGRVSPHVDIAGSWDEYLASRPRKVTHEWERKLRKAEREAGFVFRELAPDTDLDALVAGFVAVDARSWREGEGTSIGGRGAEGFYGDVTRVLAGAGRLSCFWLEVDGRAVAFVYGAVFGGVYYALKTSFDEAFSKLSPGVVLFHGAIRRAFEAGLSRFDFVGETARWKEEWATGRREHASVVLYPAGPGGLAGYARDAWLKPAVRRLRGGRP
ncbi:MAG: GNAT family N-acetyltransferase [Candidatus Eisenbacteria bacterium]|nr:GNAT family N-acetyltransferase [Candidatus Eisenbacteria bacterium]